ncbi:MAG: hypothetical protein K9I85_15485 [Saprospiraceae bacterium]|nr:hypothetical protein [Saprospiraceae bacterium]
MKKITISLILCGWMAFLPIQSHAITHASPVERTLSGPVGDPEADALVKRLLEIKEMDTSTLSRSEKRALREEARSIEKALKHNNGGVYISMGSAILIIVLLILFL